MRSFWELESVGISSEDEDIDPVFSTFRENLCKVDRRYETGLIWKTNMKDNLLNNEKLARIRLQQTSRKLDHNPAVKKMFDAALEEMLVLNIIEEVPSEEVASSSSEEPVYYMPCRPPFVSPL